MRRSVSASPAPHEGTRLLGRVKLVDEQTFTFANELGYLAATSLPVALSYALQNSLQTLSVVVVGRLGPHELSVAAFSYSECRSPASWSCCGCCGECETSLWTIAYVEWE